MSAPNAVYEAVSAALKAAESDRDRAEAALRRLNAAQDAYWAPDITAEDAQLLADELAAAWDAVPAVLAAADRRAGNE